MMPLQNWKKVQVKELSINISFLREECHGGCKRAFKVQDKRDF